MKFEEIDDSTPLAEEDKAKLIPNLKTQAELNEFEAQNIAAAIIWARGSSKLKKNLLSVTGLKLLHKKMFNKTWNWAGEFRQRATSVGVDKDRIQSDLKILLGDVEFWMKNETYSIEEIAIRLHHRLVWIHPFPNGNGRFSRLATDLFLKHNDQPTFTWGSGQNLQALGEVRDQYIRALRVMDKDRDSIGDLLSFAKS